MTLKEIAKMAGVSPATVSYVINDTASISDDTRRRVLEIIRETGYTSNTIARSLRVKKTHTIGVITEDITAPHTAAIIDGINEYTGQIPYNTILSNLRLMSKVKNRFEDIGEYKEEINTALNVLLGMRVDGVIYIGMHDRSLDGIIKSAGIPFVYCYCHTGSPVDVCVTCDNFQVSYDLTRKLIELGHKNIGLITGKMDSEPAHQRMMGYQRALMDLGIPMRLSHIRSGDWQYKPAKAAAMELLRQHDAPTAVYAMSDIMALGAFHAAEHFGISVPRQLSVVGFGGAEYISYTRPPLSTVSLPLREMGTRSAELLISMIHGETPEHTKPILPCTFIESGSIGCAHVMV